MRMEGQLEGIFPFFFSLHFLISLFPAFDVQQYTRNLAILFNIDVNRISIISVKRGSVIATFFVSDTPASSAVDVVQPSLNEFSVGILQTRANQAGISPILNYRMVAINNPNSNPPLTLETILIMVISASTIVLFVILLTIACFRYKKYEEEKNIAETADAMEVFSKQQNDFVQEY